MKPTSATSSPLDPDEDLEIALSIASLSTRKRKRSSFEQDSGSDEDSLLEPSTKATKLFGNTTTSALVEDSYRAESGEQEDVEEDAGEEYDDQDLNVEKATLSINQAQPKSSLETPMAKQKHQKGKRKGKKSGNEILGDTGNSGSRVESPTEYEENQDAALSVEEEDDNDEPGNVAEADNSMKTEEGGKWASKSPGKCRTKR